MITSIKLTFYKMEKSFMNRSSAQEWLTKAWHHLSSAQILFQADHYADIIGVELHYAIEITLKSLLAYDNRQIKKTHELFEIYSQINLKNDLDEEEVRILLIATKYHILEAYPSPHRKLPDTKEIEKVLNFSLNLFSIVCIQLDINPLDCQ